MARRKLSPKRKEFTGPDAESVLHLFRRPDPSGRSDGNMKPQHVQGYNKHPPARVPLTCLRLHVNY